MARDSWISELSSALSDVPVVDHSLTVTLADVHGERPHLTKTHELVHVIQGNAQIIYGRRAFPVGPGDTFIVPRLTLHRDRRTREVPCRFTYVFFLWPSGDALLRAINPHAYLRASAAVRSYLHLLMGDFEREYLSDAPSAAERGRVILLEMLLAVIRCSHGAGSRVSRSQQRVAEQRRKALAASARDYLLRHYDQPLNLEDLAGRLNVSPFHLSRTVSREYGLSLMDMLTTIRVERAKELLKGGDHAIKQIAALTGYANSNYFARVFRRTCGLAPTEFQLLASKPRPRR
ncbi:MAG TPA: helix-turn-helix domain-containing protein [Candidatus Brocadiia bacterium]|nr:helix-turn-helix domain-containing protein [Candidatus Brocadiia bacterium]